MTEHGSPRRMSWFLSVPQDHKHKPRERRNSDGCVNPPGFLSNAMQHLHLKRDRSHADLQREARDHSRERSRDHSRDHSREHSREHHHHHHHSRDNSPAVVPHEKTKKDKQPLKCIPSLLDSNLIEVLRRNYDLVSALADIEGSDESSAPSKMKGPIPRIATESPRPLILREHNPYNKYHDESTSISSADTNGSDLEPESFWTRTKRELRWFALDVAEALETPRDSCPEAAHQGEKLSAVALKKDLKRCYAALHPFIEVAAALYDLLLWKNPISSLLLTLVYMYSVYRGWTASLVLLLVLLQLSLNYLSARKNIDIGLSFLPRKEVASPRFDISGAQLIFDIAKVAQQLLRFSADFLEKLHSMLTWKDVRVSRVFYCLVIYWLLLSLIFNTGTCLGMCAMTFGVRIFITTYLFDRFPRLKNRLDTYGWFYRNLPVKNFSPVASPVHPQSARLDDERSHSPSSGTRRSTICIGETFVSRLGSNFNLDRGSSNNLQSVSEAENAHMIESGSFSANSLSGEEEENTEESSGDDDPMIDNVVAFRSCVMNEKEKMFPKGITSGIVYLTDAALIFRSRSTADNKEPVMLLFHDIVSVKKIHSLRSMSLIAGTRKSIEVLVAGRRKPLQFVGVAKRDDFVARMEHMCAKQDAATHFIVD